MDLYVGTSGYNYKEWKGPFYPEKMTNREMLGFYGRHFRSVEINSSFYRVPKPDVVESWASQVGDDFRFVMKATRRITHIKRLKEVDEEAGYFLGIAAYMKEKLGAILFQLPPYLRKNADRLRTFVDLLPDGTPGALEFRHESWFDEEVYDCLRSKNLALCVVHDDPDEEEGDGRETPFVATADWGYLRLRGAGYSDEDLKTWKERILRQKWERAFVYFKHEAEGLGPALAKRFIEA